MPDEQSPPPNARMEGVHTAWLLGTILLAGVALMAILTVRDRSHVSALEEFKEVSAVGDMTYFQLPKPQQQPPARAATLHGVALYPVSHEKVKVDDPGMIRAARDEASALTLYRTRESIESEKREPAKKEDHYFLKIAPGEYIEVRSAKP